jgi:hypothetical protein
MDPMTFAVRGGGESTMSSDEESKRDKRDSKDVEVEDRRNVLKGGIVVGGAAVAAALTLPKKWSRPLVEAVVVPAHAQTSPGAPTPSPTPSPTPGG